jgi:hypothetical protein
VPGAPPTPEHERAASLFIPPVVIGSQVTHITQLREWIGDMCSDWLPALFPPEPQARVCGPWAYLDMSRADAALKTKGFPARAGRFRSKMRGHTTDDRALAAARVHGVSVGARRGAVAGPTFRRRVDRPHFLVAQNEGLIAARTEKACDLKA